MRVLITSLVYWPDPTGNGPLLTDLAEWLAERGHTVSVVSGFPHYGQDEVPARYRGRFFMVEERNGVRIFRVFNWATGKRGKLRKLLGYLAFTVNCVFAAIFAGRADVVFAPSPPLSVGLSAWLISRFKRAPFIYNVQDLFPEAYVELGMLNKPGLVRFFKKMAGFVYKRAARVVSVMETLSEAVRSYGVPADQALTVFNWTDVSEISPQPRDNDFSREQGLDGKFVVEYSGNIGMSQRVDLLLDCAERLREENDYFFLIIGSGERKKSLMEAAERRGLDNVRFLPVQPRERLPEVLATSNVAVVPLTAGMSRTSFPSKIYTIMAAGRPMIAALDLGSEPRGYVEKHQCALTIDPDNLEALMDALRTIHDNPQMGREMGERGRRAISATDPRREALEAYEQILTEVAQKR